MRINSTEAITRLKQGEVIALPTETVYGLAASIHHEEAIRNIYRLKGRPSNNPLIVHLATRGQLLVPAPPRGFDSLADHFWPGPLTLLVEAPTTLSPLITAGLSTVALRIPSHLLTLDLLQEIGPCVAPSANLSGSPSATSPAHVEADFGASFPILDGGECPCGVESTILHYLEERWVIVRQGALPAEMFVSVLGYVPELLLPGKNPVCPGQLYRHYAPKTRLRLTLHPEGAVVGFSNKIYLRATRVFELGPHDAPEEVAHHLYAVLRQLDEERISEADVDLDMPSEGLWATIQERLKKASQN